MTDLAQVAQELNIIIEKGATFRYTITITDEAGSGIDFTDAVIEAQIRYRFDDADPLVSFTIENRIDESGQFEITIPHATTQTLDEMTGVWDLEVLFLGGDKIRYLQGTVKVSLEVTQ